MPCQKPVKIPARLVNMVVYRAVQIR
jgi:hypothetical protein